MRAQEIVAEPNLPLFTVFAALNMAGYDAGAEEAEGNPIRSAVRQELAQKNIPSLPMLREFVRDHRLADPARNLSQYVSLALSLSGPPRFELDKSPVNLPPDVLELREMALLIGGFYEQADIEGLWAKHLPAMEQESEQYQRLLARLIQQTNGYLRMDTAGYWNRRFAIYLNPLGPPNQTDARSYEDDYTIVVGPASELPEEEIRHGWLHYLLDPYPLKYPNVVESKSELQRIAQRSPALDPAVRESFSLLLTESLIRAIQARQSAKGLEEKRKAVQEAVEEGFVLTTYFFEALEEFEKQPVGMRLYFPEMIEAISVKQEQQRLAATQFRTTPVERRRESQWSALEQMLQVGEQTLAAGQYEQARLIYESLSKQYGTQPQVLYGLAIVASQQRQPELARQYFTQAASLTSNPRTRAWSHIYLGRLLDLEGKREAALAEYRAALEAGDSSAETRTAAEKGLQESFAPAGREKPPADQEPEEEPRKRVPLGKD